jgi:uncharacterized membrane protein
MLIAAPAMKPRRRPTRPIHSEAGIVAYQDEQLKRLKEEEAKRAAKEATMKEAAATQEAAAKGSAAPKDGAVPASPPEPGPVPAPPAETTPAAKP